MTPVDPPRSSAQRAVGALLVVPALVALLGSRVEPTRWTLRTSLRRLDILTGIGREPGGLDNYRQVFSDGFAGQFAFALSLAVGPLLVALVAAPALARALHRAGRRATVAGRIVLALPLALYAPVGVVAAWRLSDDAPGTRMLVWLATAGLVAAVATTAHLAALRGPAGSRRPGALVTAAVAALAVIAVAVQGFAVPALAALGAAPDQPSTPLAAGAQTAAFGRAGPATAVAVLVFVVVALLGLAAVGLLIATRTRLTVTTSGPAAAPAGPGATTPGAAADRRPALAGAVVGLVAVVAVLLFSHRHWLAGWSPAAAPDAILRDTWLPPLLAATVGVLLAALAAFGIGWLRPLGRRSELLLLPFAPWLLVGSTLFAQHTAAARRGADADWWTLVPPDRLAVPVLVLLTLLFAGLAAEAPALAPDGRVARASDRVRLLRSTLPMIGLGWLATWVVYAQGLTDPAGPSRTAPDAIWQEALRGGPVPVGLTRPVPLLLALLTVAVLAQVTYLDRVGLRAGPPGVGRRERGGPDGGGRAGADPGTARMVT